MKMKLICMSLTFALIFSAIPYSSTIVSGAEAAAVTGASQEVKPATTTAKPAPAKKSTSTKAVTAKPVATQMQVKSSSAATGTEFTNDKGQLCYVVAIGDNLTKIAKRYGITYQEIAKANDLKFINLIYPKQELIIPVAAVPTTAKPVVVAPTPTPAKPVVTAPTTAPAPQVQPAKPAKPAVDVVTGASEKESSDVTKLAKGLSKDGTWIFAILSDVKVDGELNVDGEFHDKGDPTTKIYRKLALYAQDADHKVTANYTLTVKKINVTSPNFRIQNGKVVGDVYVNADGFELAGTTIEGNVYFATQEQLDSALLDKGTITGKKEVKAVVATDAVTGASEKESSDVTKLAKGLSKDGTWIFSILSDVKVDGDLNVDGEFHDKGDPATKIYRKLALYAQDADHKVTANYTLTVKKINVTSPNFRIQNGKVVGDIYVNADGFELAGTTIEGNVYFATQAQLDSAILDKGTITGKKEVKAVVATDAVTGASEKESSDVTKLAKGLSKNGTWIFAILSDVKVDGDLNVDGEFHDKGDPTTKVYRKLALYAQDADHKVTANYTLTLKKLNVTTPNFRIQNGKVVGDVYVNANGFELAGTTIEGNVYFATQAQLDSAILDKGKITGKTALVK